MIYTILTLLLLASWYMIFKLFTKVEKHEEPAPKTVKLSLDSSTIQEGIEHIGMSAYNTEKTCIFRLECLANIS